MTDTEACLSWLHKNCFKEIIQMERTLEEHKIALVNSPDFNLGDAFALFSGNSLSRLAQSDLSYGF